MNTTFYWPSFTFFFFPTIFSHSLFYLCLPDFIFVILFSSDRPETFSRYLQVRSLLREQQLAEEFEVQLQERLREQNVMSLLAKIVQERFKSDSAQSLVYHKNFIAENILTLRCPACRQGVTSTTTQHNQHHLT